MHTPLPSLELPAGPSSSTGELHAVLCDLNAALPAFILRDAFFFLRRRRRRRRLLLLLLSLLSLSLSLLSSLSSLSLLNGLRRRRCRRRLRRCLRGEVQGRHSAASCI